MLAQGVHLPTLDGAGFGHILSAAVDGCVCLTKYGVAKAHQVQDLEEYTVHQKQSA